MNLLIFCSFCAFLASFVSADAVELDPSDQRIMYMRLSIDGAIQELRRQPGLDSTEINPSFLKHYIILHLKLFGNADDELKSTYGSSAIYTPEQAIMQRNVSCLAFGRNFLGVSAETVLGWSHEVGIQKLLSIKDCIDAKMFSGIKLSELIFTATPDINVPDEILDAIENLLIRAELTKKLHRKHKNLLKEIFEPFFDEIPTSYSKFDTISLCLQKFELKTFWPCIITCAFATMEP